MKFNFSFNSNTHDFWEIYDSIKKYYPIGLDLKEGQGIYYQYHGLKELEKIVINNVHNSKNYQVRWVNFTTEIGKNLGKEIVGTTYGQAPSFSSSIILKKVKIENFIHTKALHFSVSFVGKYFQVYGLDSTATFEEKERVGYSNLVTTSPFKEYQESFEYLEKELRKKFPKYKIIPFWIGQTIINGLNVRYLDDKNCSVNKALFNNFLSEENILKWIRGDKYYGNDDWIKKE